MYNYVEEIKTIFYIFLCKNAGIFVAIRSQNIKQKL